MECMPTTPNRNKESLRANAKSPCYQPGPDMSDHKTPVVMMMMMLLNENCLYARGILVCATVVARQDPVARG